MDARCYPWPGWDTREPVYIIIIIREEAGHGRAIPVIPAPREAEVEYQKFEGSLGHMVSSCLQIKTRPLGYVPQGEATFMLCACPRVCEFSLGIHAGKMSHECSQQLQVSPGSPEQDGFHDAVDKHMTSNFPPHLCSHLPTPSGAVSGGLQRRQILSLRGMGLPFTAWAQIM